MRFSSASASIFLVGAAADLLAEDFFLPLALFLGAATSISDPDPWARRSDLCLLCASSDFRPVIASISSEAQMLRAARWADPCFANEGLPRLSRPAPTSRPQGSRRRTAPRASGARCPRAALPAPNVPVPAIAACPVEADPLEAMVQPQGPSLRSRLCGQLPLGERFESQNQVSPAGAFGRCHPIATCISGPNPTSAAHRFHTSTGSAPPAA